MSNHIYHSQFNKQFVFNAPTNLSKDEEVDLIIFSYRLLGYRLGIVNKEELKSFIQLPLIKALVGNDFLLVMNEMSKDMFDSLHFISFVVSWKPFKSDVSKRNFGVFVREQLDLYTLVVESRPKQKIKKKK